MSRPSSPNTTQVDRTQLAEIISQNAKNNFSKVLGLTYFCGGPETFAGNPQLLCATTLLEWLKDIDARTAVQWDDAGRVQLCKQYALGPVFSAVTNAVREHGNDWTKVKSDLLLVFPDTKSFETKRMELVAMRRRPGETLPEFYTRIRSKAGLLKEEKPAAAEIVNRDAVSALLQTLPLNFQAKLVDTDYTQPQEVYTKAVRYVRFNPQLKLDDEQVRKENKHTVAALVAPPPHSTPPMPPPPMTSQGHRRLSPSSGAHTQGQTGRRGNLANSREGTMTCFRCGFPGHVARVCRAPVCHLCGDVGHIAPQCRRSSSAGRGHLPRMGSRNVPNHQNWAPSPHSNWGNTQGRKNFQRRGN